MEGDCIAPAGGGLAAIALRTTLAGYLLDRRGVLFTTQDGGQTWSGASSPGDALYFFTFSTGWALAPKIQVTTDGGKTWKPISDVSWTAQFDFISETTGWVIATSGNEMALVKTDNGGARWSILVPTVK